MPTTIRHLDYIELQGYKSFRKLDKFPMQKGLNVLIGANGSGKTNFIRFFELLGNMMDTNKGLQNYLSHWGRADAFLFRGSKVTDQLSAHLWFKGFDYEFSLKAAANRTLFFSHESTIEHLPSGPKRSEWNSGDAESRLPFAEFMALVDGLADGEERVQNEALAEESVSRIIRFGLRVYHFQDTSPQARVMGLSNLVDNQYLHADAGNAAALLLKMRETHRNHYDRIIKTVRLVAPFFGDFELGEVAPGQTQLLWKERYSDLVFYPHQLSDGSIRFICLAILLLQPNPPPIILIDEPELGLHPYAIEVLAGLFREAAARCQLIVSTQSRQLVDEFEPEDLIVADRVDGETKLSRPNSGELGKWLEDYSLGELWGKNVLGGRPGS